MGKKGKARSRQKEQKKERRRAMEADLPELAASIVDEPVPPAPDAAAIEATPRRKRAATAEPTELAARLANLSTVLQRELGQADTGDGLTRARLSALALLVLGGPRTLGSLAAAERVRPPTMTRLVHAMEADGLVVRERHPSDGRSVIIRATPAGQRLLEKGRARRIVPLAASIARLDASERHALEAAADLLGRLLRDVDWESREPRP